MVDQPNITGTIRSVALGGNMTKIVRTSRDLPFSEVLKTQLERKTGITFSAHAVERLNERGIVLGDDELARLSQAVTKADEKGAEDSLILLNEMAFIVSIKNSTVITAIPGDAMKDKVFTNIDSAIIA